MVRCRNLSCQGLLRTKTKKVKKDPVVNKEFYLESKSTIEFLTKLEDVCEPSVTQSEVDSGLISMEYSYAVSFFDQTMIIPHVHR